MKEVFNMNLYELFKKFETEFLAGHEKIKTGLDFELFVGKLSEQILGDVYSLDTVYKTGGNHKVSSNQYTFRRPSNYLCS